MAKPGALRKLTIAHVPLKRPVLLAVVLNVDVEAPPITRSLKTRQTTVVPSASSNVASFSEAANAEASRKAKAEATLRDVAISDH